MLLGNLRERNPLKAAVTPNLVEVVAPIRAHAAGQAQGLAPLLVQALIAELAIEVFDVVALHGLARRDQDVLDAMADRSVCGRSAGDSAPLAGGSDLAVDGLLRRCRAGAASKASRPSIEPPARACPSPSGCRAELESQGLGKLVPMVQPGLSISPGLRTAPRLDPAERQILNVQSSYLRRFISR